MIDLKNRSRESRVYQYPRNVSAGPVRPQVLDVVRGSHDPKTGVTSQAPKKVTVGGVLTLPPKSTVSNLPDVLLDHPSLQRDIASRAVAVKRHPNQNPKKPSTAPTERPKRSKGKAASKDA